jgi:hypothetical protein
VHTHTHIHTYIHTYRRIADEVVLERLAMVVKNHILEIQNIELQMREKAKEHLRERMLVEVGKNNQVQGFLPKIEIAKWPSGDERQLFTPSTKAPMVMCVYVRDLSVNDPVVMCMYVRDFNVNSTRYSPVIPTLTC